MRTRCVTLALGSAALVCAVALLSREAALIAVAAAVCLAVLLVVAPRGRHAPPAGVLGLAGSLLVLAAVLNVAGVPTTLAVACTPFCAWAVVHVMRAPGRAALGAA